MVIFHNLGHVFCEAVADFFAVFVKDLSQGTLGTRFFFSFHEILTHISFYVFSIRLG